MDSAWSNCYHNIYIHWMCLVLFPWDIIWKHWINENLFHAFVHSHLYVHTRIPITKGCKEELTWSTALEDILILFYCTYFQFETNQWSVPTFICNLLIIFDRKFKFLNYIIILIVCLERGFGVFFFIEGFFITSNITLIVNASTEDILHAQNVRYIHLFTAQNCDFWEVETTPCR